MPVVNKELVLGFIKEFFGKQRTADTDFNVNWIDNVDKSVNVIVELPHHLAHQSAHLESFLKNRVNHVDATKKHNIIISALTEKMHLSKHSIKKTIAIASGKGGVGKSTLTKNIAHASLRMGLKTALLDADIHGPSIPVLFDLEGTRLYKRSDNKLEPIIKDNLKIMSIGFLIPPEKAVIWRGPMVMGAIEQMYRDTDWGDVDLLLVDLPPGTGDAQLTLAQKVPLDGVIMVTIPNKLALADVKRAADMFRKMGIPILGLIENMSHFLCPHCHVPSPLFSEPSEYDPTLLDLPILAKIPFIHLEDEQSSQHWEHILKIIFS